MGLEHVMQQKTSANKSVSPTGESASSQLAFAWEEGGEARIAPGEGLEARSAAPRPVALAQDGQNGQNGLVETDLMETVVAAENMRHALQKVCANKGSPGVDGMTVEQLETHLRQAWPPLRTALLSGEYKPAPIRRVDIPKPDGSGTRQLGIPTVVDRLIHAGMDAIQQALLQVLEPLYDPTFSPNSYGFRPGKSAHQALSAAQEHVAAGYSWVVDLDLEKFFDRVNHDMLMGRLAKRIGDKRILRLIRRYLEAGTLSDGVVLTRHEGTPQGGPLSPLLANILLDDLDKELESRGHRFCRYADDCNIYVQSERAGQRVMASDHNFVVTAVTQFVEKKLKLKVNRSKSAVDRPRARKFLGQRVLGGRAHTYLGVHPKSVLRAKKTIRTLTRRNRGVSLGRVLWELGRYTDGWVAYHRYARCSTLLQRMDEWMRRRLRCYLWKQWKTPRRRAEQLLRLGVPPRLAYGVASNNDGLWKCAGTPALTRALTNVRLQALGFHSLQNRYRALASS